jgi:DNA-binding CsgD family transcriptional regulator
MTPSVETISKLLGSLYEAAAAPERWPEFLNSLQRLTNADTAYFILVDPTNRCNLSMNYGFDPAWERAYVEYYSQYDLVKERIMAAKQPRGEWVGTRESVLSDAELDRSLIYNEFMKPMGMLHQCALAIGGLEGWLEGGLGLERGPQAEAFGQETTDLLAVLAPHMTAALNMHRTMSHLRSQNAELRRGVGALDLALISLDGKGRVLRCTEPARALLKAGEGLTLVDGRLHANLSWEQARLQELVAGAAATGMGAGATLALRRDISPTSAETGAVWTPHPGGSILISRPEPKRPLQLVVSPFQSSEALLEDRPAALVFIRDPDEKPASRSSVLRALYSLTPTECRLVDRLAQGEELATAADHMGMTVETARFHLKTVFRKTGTSRQTDLVRLVLGLPGLR